MNLKPIVFVRGKYAYNAENNTQQIMLIKALRITKDPRKLKELIGVRTVAEVYRTLDKIAMRKEYHSALAKSGITFDYVVEKLKDEIDNGEKSRDRLTGLSILLKSIGLDKYEETAISGGGWEDALLNLNKDVETGKINSTVKEYDVIEPSMPENVRLAKEKANKDAKGLYE